ncbi:hypothetical protein [Actinacidiphila yeochonensis]|uniref:hypothetical protein n=1 Tax=Actinacidiphila yeochonensis TaxID=89050 RepID=UPI000561514F|nr:hypothetical protein [Actinacidiphila yeochonensis]
MTGPLPQRTLLDWRDGRHYTGGGRCVLCRGHTVLQSHSGEDVCKVCAEAWNAAHPGETRFVSDPPRARRKPGA